MGIYGTGAQELLCEMLDCGTCDLELLDRVGYSWKEVLDQTDYPGDRLTFNDLMRGVVSVGIINIREAVDDRICELEAIPNEDLDEDEKEELRLLRTLDPDNDIRSYHNCLDTDVWFERNGSIYRRYLPEVIDDFEGNVGFFLTGGEE